MYEVLVYLYEHCHRTDLSQDNQLITRKLSAAGFEESDISEALTWLAGAAVLTQPCLAPLPAAVRALRAYATKECAKLDVECRGFVMHLENIGVLDPGLRELVVDRAMAAAGGALTIEQLKLIVLMVLWNLETPASRILIEDLLSPDDGRLPH